MKQRDVQRVQQELTEAASRYFPGAVREVVVLQYGDDPIVEPGEVVLRLLASEQVSKGKGPPEPVFGNPAMSYFRLKVTEQLPEARRIEVISESAVAKRKSGFLVSVGGDEPKAATDLTPVMVRLRTAELEIVDTLISVGIAANRAEAVRWALARISERPAYGQLRERTREIERLKSEF